MARTRAETSNQDPVSSRPFMTPEGQENYCISLAYNLAEKRLLNGTATSQEVCTFLNRGSQKERLELERLQEENKLLRAKTEALAREKNTEELYAEVLTAMRKYSGYGDQQDYEEY